MCLKNVMSMNAFYCAVKWLETDHNNNILKLYLSANVTKNMFTVLGI